MRRLAIALSLAASSLGLTGCPPRRPIESGATVKAEDLPKDRATLLARVKELTAAGDAVSLENAIVFAEAALGGPVANAVDPGPKDPVSTPAAPEDYEPAWRGARAAFLLADLADGDKGRRIHFAEKTLALARRAAGANDKGAEARYYEGLGFAYLARTRSIGALELVPTVVREAKAAIELDARVDHCGPLRLLGTLQLRVPSWPSSVGDKEEGLETLRRAATECPEHPGNRAYYAEALDVNDEDAKAIPELEAALALPSDPDWATMLPGIRAEAEKRLARLKK